MTQPTMPARPGAGGADYDVVIVGAGVVGSAIARALSRLQISVALVDAANDVGQGTSKANTAILHTGFDATPGTLESRLVAEGYHLLGAYPQQTGIPVERTGAVLVAWTEEQLATLPELADKASQNGYHHCHQVSAEEVYTRLPALGPGALGGLVVPGEAIICTWTTTLALATEAVRNDVVLHLEHELVEVRTHGEITTVRTSNGELTTRWLINAAGLGADVIDRMLGYDRFTVTPRRGELLVFDKLARPRVPMIVLPVPSKAGKGVLVSPTVYGNVMLGPTAEDLTDKTATGTSEEGFAFLADKGTQLMPDLFDEEVTAAYAGLRASIESKDYLIETDPEQRYILIGGIRSTGLTASMAIAEHVRGRVGACGGRLPPKAVVGDPPKMPYSGEVAQRPYADPERIAADADYGQILCFCERVTAGEVRDALTATIPARDRSGLSRRTRATNGRCQGFYCGAEIQARLDRAGQDRG